MFWSKPKSPITPEDQEWTEANLNWLLDEFNEPKVKTVTPSKEFFNYQFTGKQQDAEYVLETVKKLRWAPDVIHCNDWMTSLIPLYVKTTYKSDPIFQNAKTVFTVHDTKFNHVFGDDLLEKVKMIDIEDGMLDLLKTANFEGFIKIGMQYADAISNADGQVSASFKTLIKSLSEGNDISDIKQDENFEESYYKLYNELIG